MREDGTTVGVLETLEFIREDMQLVADRLARGKADRGTTQAVERDIIMAIEEILAVFD